MSDLLDDGESGFCSALAAENRQKTGADESCCYPLGVHLCGGCVSFCVSFPGEAGCVLKLYKAGVDEPFLEKEMTEHPSEKGIFSTVLPCAEACGAEYLYETPAGVKVDTYARRITGRSDFGVRSVGESCRAAVDFAGFAWQDYGRPERDFSDMILYKLHVRGFTKHKSSHVRDRGTFLGLTQKLDYLKELGINAVLLLPCVEFDELFASGGEYIGRPSAQSLPAEAEYGGAGAVNGGADGPGDGGRVNYWGYGCGAFYFAPKASYAANPDNACLELKQTVNELHLAGIEVLIDMDFALERSQSKMLEVLRFWHREYHIDGFRINTSQLSPELAATDSRLCGVKLLASDFDIDRICGEGMPDERRLARFNDAFMYDARKFVKADENMVERFKDRLRANDARAGIINYITNHDGFTLYDLFSYDIKHNEENGEDNRDGNEFNFSWNCGTEGPTKSRRITELRLQMCKNAVAALFMSQGTPMLLAGDEFLNSQYGNNNAYCQDNETSWLKWKNDRQARSMTEFVKQLAGLRLRHRVLSNRLVLRGMDYIFCGNPDISFHGVRPWYPDYSNYSRTLGVLLCGSYATTEEPGGQLSDESFYVIFNMHWENHEFDLPTPESVKCWRLLFSTAQQAAPYEQGMPYMAAMRSVTVFVSEDDGPEEAKKPVKKRG